MQEEKTARTRRQRITQDKASFKLKTERFITGRRCKESVLLKIRMVDFKGVLGAYKHHVKEAVKKYVREYERDFETVIQACTHSPTSSRAERYTHCDGTASPASTATTAANSSTASSSSGQRTETQRGSSVRRMFTSRTARSSA
jgi:glutamate racemase